MVTCTCCGRVSVCYEDLLVEFERQAFLKWANWLVAVDYLELVQQPIGRNSFVSLRTCHPSIQFVFDQKDFGEFQSMLGDTLLVLGVFEGSRAN